MKLIAFLLSFLRPSDEDATLDHVPVQSESLTKFKRARKEALKRHGKQFHCDSVKPRESEPSEFLKALQPKPTIVLADNVAVMRKAGAK